MTQRITRRALVCSLTGLVASLGAFCLPCVSEAQQPAATRRIGVLSISFSPESTEAQAFRRGLRDAGFSEGRDVAIEWRFADGNYDRLPGFTEDLVRSKVDVIVTDGTVAAQSAKRVTSTIPIVMALASDPVGSGLIKSLAHPGGNITGLSMMIPELSIKRLQLLKELNPGLARALVLWNPASPYHARVIEKLKAESPLLGIELSFISVQTPEEIKPAVAAVGRIRAQALYVIEDPVTYSNRMTLLKLVSAARVPAVYPVRRFVDDGGLISYGTNFPDLFRRSAGYAGKILNGSKPADLPVKQPIKFDLVLNLRTAKAIGLTIPQSVLLRADEVIR